MSASHSTYGQALFLSTCLVLLSTVHSIAQVSLALGSIQLRWPP